MREIVSPVFGKTFLLEEEEEEFKALKGMVDKHSVDAFGLINKKLTGLGFALTLHGPLSYEQSRQNKL